MRFVDPWRNSPLLWTAGVIVLTPLIVLGGVVAIAMAAVSGIWRGVRTAQQLGGSAGARDPVLAPVVALRPSPAVALRPSPADELESVPALGNAA